MTNVVPLTNSQVNIGGTAVKDALSATQSAAMKLQLYTQTVTQTPDIKLNANLDQLSNSKVVSDLPAHQKIARTNAETYLNTINPTLVAKSADVIGFHNLWSAEYSRLVDLARAIDAPGNSDQFKAGLQNLINQTQTKQSATAPVITALNDFLPAIQQDQRNIAGDLQNVTIALDGVDGEIDRLKQVIDADNAAIKRDIGLIAGGVVAIIGGAIMIVVGVVAEAVTGGAATALVIGGIAAVGAGGTAVGLASKNLEDVQKDLAQKSTTLHIDQLCFASTKQASHTVSALEEAISEGVSAVIALQKGWGALAADLQQVIEQLDTASPDLGSWLVNILEAANADWQAAYSLAERLQSFGTLPVKTHDLSKAAQAA